MKTRVMFTFMLTLFVFSYGQTEKIKHFEFDTSIMLWSPSSLSLLSNNSVTQYAYPDGSYLSAGSISGYGTSITPALDFTYFFNKELGITLGFEHVNMDNELSVIETDSTSSNYENIASVDHLTLGGMIRLDHSPRVRSYYSFGIDLVANYDLEQQYSDESSDPPDLNADDSAIGLYFEAGLRVRLYKFVSLNSGLNYSYIPVEMEYTNSEGTVKINEKTNLGGIGLKTGLTFDF